MAISIESVVRTSLLPIVPIVEPHRYDGEALEYITFNYTELPGLHADGRPGALRYLLQIHWYLPHGTNPNEKKRQIAEELWAAGLTYPSVVDASDDDGQHYVFECEGASNGNV